MRLAVVSPFLDRRHGTERCVVEQLERLATTPGVEVHLYSQSVENLSGMAPWSSASSARIFWHKVPRIGGPHLLAYFWWFLANQVQRWWDSRIRGLKFDLRYSPGINALDADAIAVHIVFHELYHQLRPQLKLRGAPIASWPRFLHRRLYYRLLMWLERRTYRRRRHFLSAVSDHVASQLKEHFQREDVAVIRNGVDAHIFSPELRRARRGSAREQFFLSPSDFCLLLIGNDCKTKGLDALLDALLACRESPLKLLVVGSDDRTAYEQAVKSRRIEDRVRFLDPRGDVLAFYAAADAYVGPSLVDAFGLPVLEAMACGLPVIASSRSGVSEIISHGRNGMILRNPEDHQELAGLLQTLCTKPELCRRLGEEARKTAQEQNWDVNAAEAWRFLQEAVARKAARGASDERKALSSI